MNDKPSVEQKASGKLRKFWFLLPVTVFIVASVLGYWGLARFHQAAGRPLPWWDLIYLTLQLFILESGMVDGTTPWMLAVARMLAMFFTASAAILAMSNICRTEIRLFRMSRLKNHVVVCGVGDKAEAILRDFREKKIAVVAIDINAHNRLLSNRAGYRLFVLEDDATRPAALAKARVQTAKYVFVMTGNDSVNIEIASQVIKLFPNEGGPTRNERLVCHVHMVNRRTNDLFRSNHVFQESAQKVDMRIFNIYDNAARLLWRNELVSRGPVKPDDLRRMHVVIEGLGQMGEAVLLRTVKSGHFANGRKPAFTIVDRQAGAVRERLFQRHPTIASLCDLDFIKGDIGSVDTLRRVGECLAGPDEIGSVVLCADNDHENFAAALLLASSLSRPEVPIFVRLTMASGLAGLLKSERSESSLARQIEAFGLISDCCSVDVVLEDRMCRFACDFHRAYVRKRLQAGVNPADPALKNWEDLSELFRESSCEQAEHMEFKLRTVGRSSDLLGGAPVSDFTDEQVEFLAKMEHARWCAERLIAGWKFAPGPKDTTRRTSPYLVSWEQLDESIRQIDRDAVREIPAILAGVESAAKISAKQPKT